MKKLLLIASMIALSFVATEATAQAPVQLVNPSGTAGIPDSVVGSATTYFVIRIPGPGKLTLQLNVKKVSGTVAGYAVLQGSIDKDYSPTMWADISTDTATLINGDYSKLWAINSDYLHYRVKLVTTSGTMRLAPKVFASHRKTFGP